jgi:Flp pilus assembly protein TadD
MSFWRNQLIEPVLASDLSEAIRDQERILKRDPTDSRAHFALGTLLQMRGEAELAVTLFTRAIELDPAYAAPHVSLGRIKAVEGDYESAWKHAHEAERLGDPSLVEQLERYPNLQ